MDLIDKIAAVSPGMGIPNPKDLGDIMKLYPGLWPYVLQRHAAERAGLHHDLRFGKDKMYSWAVPLLVPPPGKKHLAIQQPLHAEPYKHFEGTLKGYGAGTVKKEQAGEVLVTKVRPDEIHYTTASTGSPERFVLKKLKPRGGKDKDWLLINTTPRRPPEYPKPSYKVIPAEQVEKVFQPGMSLEAKIDGARMLGKVLKNRIELLSYRTGKGGKPIVHTERVLPPGDMPEIPPELVGTEFVGELYGTRKGKAIPVQELSGLLNASIAKSLREQKAKDVNLRMSIFDIMKHKGKEVTAPRQERRDLIEGLVKALGPRFELPEAVPGEKGKEFWESIVAGRNPLTREGIVAWPQEGVPSKVVHSPESDVYIRSIFPEIGHPELAGGFEYGLGPEGPAVGRVGTGFTQAVRKEMIKNPESWIGRKARIKAKDQYGSGAYRAPSFVTRHEG